MASTSWNDIARYAMRSRGDFSISITHWTRRNGSRTAFDVLQKILKDREILDSINEGFIEGSTPATCFTETPITAMGRTFEIAKEDAVVRNHIKWEPYGLSFLKPVIYQIFKGRPVLYLSDEECRDLCPEKSSRAKFLWRVVRFDQTNIEEAIDYTHEREWRVPGSVDLIHLDGRKRPIAIVKKADEAETLRELYSRVDEVPIRGVFSMEDLRFLG